MLKSAIAAALAIGLLAGAHAGIAKEPSRASFAGRFFGTLPDAACLSLDVLLVLHADGRYTQQGHCQDDLEAPAPVRGTWSATWNDTCIRLQPEGDASSVREFAIHDDLLVLAQDNCIEPVEDPRGRSLRRAADPQRGDD